MAVDYDLGHNIIHDFCAFRMTPNILVYIVMKSQVYCEDMTKPACHK